jgi:alkylation response protein AidB-like acyl-CoA dehydrogenase
MRESAELGFGGIYSSIENGGCGLGRLEACLIFEALSYGCPVISSYLSIHNMCNWIISSFGSSDLKQKYLP